MKIIIILGNKLLKDGSMSKELIKRLNTGIKHYRKGDKIIVTGGRVEKETKYSEAYKMKKYLLENTKIDSGDIIGEKTSKNTLENAKNSYKIVKNQIVKNQIVKTPHIKIISSTGHIKRVKKIFEEIWKDILNKEYIKV